MFDRRKFFASVRETMGRLNQTQVDGLGFLLGSFEDDPKWKDVRHIAYALGTVKHETANTYQPIMERGARSYFRQYDIAHNPRKAKALGNTEPGDGYRYRGAGYVQITGKRNFAKFGIEDDPKKALEPLTAFRILSEGMQQGLFTGKKLSDFIKGSTCDYRGARKIVNGTDKNILIAGYAKNFEKALRVSHTTSAADHPTGPTPNSPPDHKGEPSETPTPPIDNPIATPPVEAVPVQTVAPAEGIDSTINRWSARVVAVPAIAIAWVGAFFTWLKDSPANIVISLVVAAALIGVAYVIGRQIKEGRDKKLADAEKQRQHEIQLALIANAADKDRNTVALVPPPVPVGNPVDEAQTGDL